MTASVTGGVAEEPLYSQACCGPKLYLVAKVWYEVEESRFHLVEHVERVPREGYMVLNEPRVVSHEKDQVLRPDLCAKKNGKTMVLDAHVPHETSAKQLTIARSDKIKKYAPHDDGFRRYLGCDDLKLDGVVVGARRAITQQMAANAIGVWPWAWRRGSHAEEGGRRLVGHIFKWFIGLKLPSMRRRSRKRRLHKI